MSTGNGVRMHVRTFLASYIGLERSDFLNRCKNALTIVASTIRLAHNHRQLWHSGSGSRADLVTVVSMSYKNMVIRSSA